eukprot:44828-Eustigmatos_ZCMA.PRE.1
MASTDLDVRPTVVYAWLDMLQRFHPMYKDITIDRDEETQQTMLGLKDELLNDPMDPADPAVAMLDIAAAADVAGVRIDRHDDD